MPATRSAHRALPRGRVPKTCRTWLTPEHQRCGGIHLAGPWQSQTDSGDAPIRTRPRPSFWALNTPLDSALAICPHPGGFLRAPPGRGPRHTPMNKKSWCSVPVPHYPCSPYHPISTRRTDAVASFVCAKTSAIHQPLFPTLHPPRRNPNPEGRYSRTKSHPSQGDTAARRRWCGLVRSPWGSR